MSNKIGVKFYSVRISERNKHDAQSEDISSFGSETIDFFTVLSDYFSHLPIYIKNKRTGKPTIKVNNTDEGIPFCAEKCIVDSVGRYISGIIWSGNSGYSSSMFNLVTRTSEYERKPSITELIPLYFLFHIPKGKRTGILALQTFGKHSLRQHLCPNLRNCFDDRFEAHILKIQPIMLGELFIDSYIQAGTLKSIEFIQYVAPKDRASGWQKQEAKCSFSVTPANRRGILPPSISSFLNEINKPTISKEEIIQAVSAVYEVSLEDTYDDINFHVTLAGGQKKKLNIDEVVDCASNFDLSDIVPTTSDGHPVFEEVSKWIKTTITDSICKIIKD